MINILKKSQEKVNNPSNFLKNIFGSLVYGTISILIFGTIISGIPRYEIMFFITLIVIYLLAIALIFLSIREKIDRLLKMFLILTGASVVGYPIIGILTAALRADYILIIVSVFICLIAFLIGIIGSIVLFKKKKS